MTRTPGNGGEKNYPGTLTALQMQLYLVIGGFRRRKNRRGDEYGMPVSVITAPESIRGCEIVTAAYGESPADSSRQVFRRARQLAPGADDSKIVRLIGRMPAE